MLPSAIRLGDLRRNTLSWCRMTRISACSAIRDRTRPTTAHQIKLHKSLIETILSRFAGDRHQGWVCGRDRSSAAGLCSSGWFRRNRIMTNALRAPIKLFQFPRMFAIPNLSPFCCKLETWLRIAHIPYEVVDTPDPRAGPKGKLPFIEDVGLRMGDTSLIVDYLAKTRGIDLDRHLKASQRGIALLVQRTLEEHYAFVTLYTHFIRADGWRYTRASFDSVPAVARALVASMARGRMRKILWMQGVLRHSDEEIIG